MRMLLILVTLAFAGVAVGCGQKGPLTLPDEAAFDRSGSAAH